MSYMLDTNICIYVINNKPKRYLRGFWLWVRARGSIYLLSVWRSFFYGLEKAPAKKEQKQNGAHKIPPLEIAHFDDKSAIEYGSISKTGKSGKPIGANDLFIAAHAVSMGVTLVTNNTKELERVENLKLENWVKDTK